MWPEDSPSHIIYFPRDAVVHNCSLLLGLLDASVLEVVGPGRVERPTYWLKASCTAIVLRTRVVFLIYRLTPPLFIVFFVRRIDVETVVVPPHLHVQPSREGQMKISLSSFMISFSICHLMVSLSGVSVCLCARLRPTSIPFSTAREINL